MGQCSETMRRWLPSALAVALASSSGVARAQSTDLDVTERESCLRGGITRVVELREGTDGGLPCEVIYLKPDEDGSSRVMWLARTERGFCAARFESLVTKLETQFAWTCEPLQSELAPRASADEAFAPPEGAPGPGRLPVDEVRVARAPASSPRIEPANDVAPSSVDRVVFPELARATPEPVTGADAERMAALRELIPSGPYRLVSADDGAGAHGGSCPPSGSFFWNTRDPGRPVFEMGPTTELPVMLPAEIDGTLVLVVEPRGRDDDRFRRRLRRTLAPWPSTTRAATDGGARSSCA